MAAAQMLDVTATGAAKRQLLPFMHNATDCAHSCAHSCAQNAGCRRGLRKRWARFSPPRWWA